MTDAETRIERERDLDRLITFVDAIVAIAITLLVLPLAELAGEAHGSERVGDLIDEHRGELWAFLLSFVVIARLWLSQHRILSPVVREGRSLTVLLLGWTLTIVLLPFPTSLLADAGDQAPTKILYIGLMALSFGLLAAMAWVVHRNDAVRDAAPVADPVPVAGASIAFLLALGISLLWPATSYYPLLLLVVDGRVTAVLRRAIGRRSRTA